MIFQIIAKSQEVFIYLFLTTVLFIGCNNNPLPPEEIPDGSQQDINWPSLADSPWPVFNGNAQGNYRTKYLGPQNGLIEWVNNDVQLTGGLTIDQNEGLYVSSWRPGGIHKIDLITGKLIWSYDSLFKRGLDVDPCPLVLYDGTIIATNGILGNLLALSPVGKLIWVHDTLSQIYNLGIGVTKDTLILFIDQSQTLYAIDKNGKLKWKVHDERFTHSVHLVFVFSPDGRTAYFIGSNEGLIAFDLVTKQIKWTFGNEHWKNFPLIDYQGHIYILSKYTDTLEPALYSLNPDGSIRWVYEHKNKTPGETSISLSMNSNGDIYFAYSDSLYCVDYYGKLKFKNSLGSNWPILIDGNDDLYIVEYKNTINAVKMKKTGELIWRIENIMSGPAGFSILTNNQQWLITNWEYYSIITSIK